MGDITLDVSEPQILRHFPADVNGVVHHHRVLLHKVDAGVWIGLSPDGDQERIDLNRIEYRILERRAPFPRDIAAQEIYAFDPVTRSEMERHKRTAKIQARLLDDNDAEEVEADIWIVSDPMSEAFGHEVTANELRQAATIAGEGVCEINGQVEHVSQVVASSLQKFKELRSGSLGDLRLLGDHRDTLGKRHLPFVQGMALLRESALADWPYDGPRAVKEFFTSVRDGSGGLLPYHLQWMTNSGVYTMGAAAHEHKVLIEALRKGMEIDQLDLSNLCMGEELVRRLIQIEVAVARNPSAPNYAGLSELMESPIDDMGQAATGQLSHWLTEKLKTKANIQKQARLYQEEFGKPGGSKASSSGGGAASGGQGRGNQKPGRGPKGRGRKGKGAPEGGAAAAAGEQGDY